MRYFANGNFTNNESFNNSNNQNEDDITELRKNIKKLQDLLDTCNENNKKTLIDNDNKKIEIRNKLFEILKNL